MIDFKEIITIHSELIDNFGGSKGVRNMDGLKAAIARPYMTFDQIELYPNPEDKAAAIFESLIINHPFIDGNKRISYFLLRFFLLEFDLDILASDLEKYELTITASKGEADIDYIRSWIKERLIKRMIVSAIVAIGENNAIGKNNQLLWHMPADLKHFKEITSGKSIIMGRKTFDSMGKPLPKRRNIVVTRQDISIPGCEVVKSIDEGLALCAGEDEVFIGGGAEIYKQAMSKTDRIYLTIIHKAFDADTFFPKINYAEWVQKHREDHDADERNPIPYSFITLERP
ncbi:MAG: type II toxin-antitoxin system death-on-curing family toxin [Bacteroidetes bacterium]|nr:type II toxin-antitoxin system death-on-curing family toxin [Bacteroidota bacterium]